MFKVFKEVYVNVSAAACSAVTSIASSSFVLAQCSSSEAKSVFKESCWRGQSFMQGTHHLCMGTSLGILPTWAWKDTPGAKSLQKCVSLLLGKSSVGLIIMDEKSRLFLREMLPTDITRIQPCLSARRYVLSALIIGSLSPWLWDLTDWKL